MSLEKSKLLRTGFTTGACATAAAAAAWRLLSGLSVENNKVDILFPDGQYRIINIEKLEKNDNKAYCTVIKDAGDDPDITNGAHISASVSICKNDDLNEEDIFLSSEKISIIIRRGEGVGKVVTKGLDVPMGKAAINPGPQEMIFKNIELLIKEKLSNPILIEISIDEGKVLAPRTLNNILGVEGGLSILGTSGLVIPCSNKAYSKTIEMLVRGAVREGEKTIFAVTGGRTHKLIQEYFNGLKEFAIIRIGDFIKQTIVYGYENGCTKIVIGCMPGKLAKYALGYEYTHAAHIRTDMGNLSLMMKDTGISVDLCNNLRVAKSIREFLNHYDMKTQKKIFKIWAKKALVNFGKWSPSMNYKIVLFGFDSQVIGEWDS